MGGLRRQSVWIQTSWNRVKLRKVQGGKGSEAKLLPIRLRLIQASLKSRFLADLWPKVSRRSDERRKFWPSWKSTKFWLSSSWNSSKLSCCQHPLSPTVLHCCLKPRLSSINFCNNSNCLLTWPFDVYLCDSIWYTLIHMWQLPMTAMLNENSQVFHSFKRCYQLHIACSRRIRDSSIDCRFSDR